MDYVKKRPDVDPCPVEAVLAIIGGKWKARILRVLADGPCTFGQLRRALGGVTQQVLSAQLKALEVDGMVHREPTELPLPPRSTYSLTDEAWSLLVPLNALALWGADRLRRHDLKWRNVQGPLGLCPDGLRPKQPFSQEG